MFSLNTVLKCPTMHDCSFKHSTQKKWLFLKTLCVGKELPVSLSHILLSTINALEIFLDNTPNSTQICKNVQSIHVNSFSILPIKLFQISEFVYLNLPLANSNMGI